MSAKTHPQATPACTTDRQATRAHCSPVSTAAHYRTHCSVVRAAAALRRLSTRAAAG